MTNIAEKLLVSADSRVYTPIFPVDSAAWQKIQNKRNLYLSGLAQTAGFEAKSGQMLIVPSEQTGKPRAVYVGAEKGAYDMWTFAGASKTLPKGVYAIEANENALTEDQAYQACVGWALAQYQYKIQNDVLNSTPADGAQLLVPANVRSQIKKIETEIESTWRARSIINAPANIFNTLELKQQTHHLAAAFNAAANCIEGDELALRFKLVHAVGRGSINLPYLPYFDWRSPDAPDNAPTILLVGKGVVMDTGGTQVKPGDTMFTMKKDMGGAAITLGLARMIMGNNLPVHLAVVIPTVENVGSERSYKPGDIYPAYNGSTVEISHTDAEGRLIMADAMAFGIEQWNPDYIFDIATLTGAQRVSDGTNVGGIYTDNVGLGRELEDLGAQWNDPLQYHRLFAEEYEGLLKAKSADICSSPRSGPGAILAGLFMKHFTAAAKPGAQWAHFDVNGANTSDRPGRPEGGEVMGMRTLYRFLEKRFTPGP